MSHRTGGRFVFSVIGGLLILVVGAGVALVAQSRRDFDVAARKYSFSVSGNGNAEIRVTQNDLVHITFSAEDIPHSFTVRDRDGSQYRIMRRAEPGRPVSFDFRADTPGTFVFYCSLSIDDKCADMHGTLVVEPRR
jgi:heme/copper-type cytochrome/quinol oxidase subunit 2